MNKAQIRDVIQKVEAGTSTAAERNALLAAVARYALKFFLRGDDADEMPTEAM